MPERERAKGLLKELGMSERRRQLYGEGIDLADEAQLSAASHGLEEALTGVGAALETAGQILGRQRNRSELERRRAALIAAVESDPHATAPLYQLCDLDESSAHWSGVAAAATRLTNLTEGEAQVEAALRAAAAHARAGRPTDAVAVLERVHRRQPGAAVVRDKLREFYETAGEFRLLAGVLLVDAEHSDDPVLRYARYRRAAELYLYYLEDAASARVPVERALELQPDDHAARMLDVDVLIQSGQLEDAGRALETMIDAQEKRTPELAVLQQRMGRIAAALGDREGQLHWLKQAFDIDRKNAEVAVELAGLAVEIGDYELALEPLRAITLMDNPAPITRPMTVLGEVEIENARGDRARTEPWGKQALREALGLSDAPQVKNLSLMQQAELGLLVLGAPTGVIVDLDRLEASIAPE